MPVGRSGILLQIYANVVYLYSYFDLPVLWEKTLNYQCNKIISIAMTMNAEIKSTMLCFANGMVNDVTVAI